MTKKHLIFLLIGLLAFGLVFCAVAGLFDKKPDTTPPAGETQTEQNTEPTQDNTQDETQGSQITPPEDKSTFVRELSLTDPMMTGDDVAQLQEVLRELGYYTTWEVDGIFGEITQQAVINYQADHGIYPSGVADKTTWDSIMKTGGRM